MLEGREQRAWHGAEKLDESWFDCSTDYECTQPPGVIIEYKNRWSPLSAIERIALAGRPSKSVPIQRQMSPKTNVRVIIRVATSTSRWRKLKFTVYAHSTRQHTAAASQEFMEENGLERAIHPPYSSDLAPSGFHLFSHVKHCLRGQSFETADELFLAIDAVLRGIEKRTLHAALLDLMQKLRQCVETNDDYFKQA
jgi:hypothetical protein